MAANGTSVAVAVRDHGIGMTPAEAARVFDRFWRADPARARTTGGSGLGLSIAAEDTKLHDGRLQAWGSKGHGSNFLLTLPLRRDEPITRSPLQLEPVNVGLPVAGSQRTVVLLDPPRTGGAPASASGARGTQADDFTDDFTEDFTGDGGSDAVGGATAEGGSAGHRGTGTEGRA